MCILRTENLCFSYEERSTNSKDEGKALCNVNFEVGRGKITAVLGGNGAGKSTLFLNLNGVLTPKSGDIYFNNQRIRFNRKEIKKLREHVGIVFQDPNDQLFSASVRNDIAFGALNMGIDKETVGRLVEQVAEQAGVTDFIDRPTHALSFGQKKRVAIAGVLIMKPDVLILDEPTAGLDPQGVSELLRLLMDIRDKSGLSIIISTHDIDIVPLYCDYAYLMKSGSIVGHGTPSELFSNPQALRDISLRMPRIAHLMEILSCKDDIPVDRTAGTISAARNSIRDLFSSREYIKKQSLTIVKNGNELRCGFTTGSCAAAAAVGALRSMLTKQKQDSVFILLPNGNRIKLDVSDTVIENCSAVCCVVKDAGDDPDATNGIKIFAEVSFTSNDEIIITGGEGIGKVMQRGLPLPVGEYAINPVPRDMIKKNIELVRQELCCNKGVLVKIYAPAGKEIAKKTFNERLGIVGGISILGTTGIVEPMSEKALLDTIKAEIDKKYACCENQRNILIAPGNYGREYCISRLGVDIDSAVKCSNYIGEALDYISYKGFDCILLVGHVGKLVKLAGGIMNTHSSNADCRMELIAMNAMLCGLDTDSAQKLLSCVTTDSAIEILNQHNITKEVFARLLDRIKYHLDYRLKRSNGCSDNVNSIKIEVILFSDNKILAHTDNALNFAKLFTNREES